MNLKSLTTLLFAVSLLSQCRRESAIEPQNAPIEQTNFFDKGKAVKINISGVVLSEYGTPVRNAEVISGSKATKTDENGFFYLSDVPGNSRLSHVVVKSLAYFTGSRSFIPQEGINQVSIQLMRLLFNGKVNANIGGTIETTGCSLELGEGFINATTGDPYYGEVNVAMRRLNPEADNFSDIMPGNLIAASDDGEKVLESYGMLAVELRDKAGNKLQLSESNSATFYMDIPDAFKTNAPKSIPLWYFDEASGVWQEEGKAELIGNQYTGIFEHFTLWNCDVPRNLSKIKARVVNSTGLPIGGMKLKFIAENGETGRCATNSSGTFTGYVPSNMKFKVNFLYQGSLISIKEIGPFSQDAELNDIRINELDNLIEYVIPVTNCKGQVLNEGIVSINYQNTAPIDPDGHVRFSFPANRPFGLLVMRNDHGVSHHAINGNNSGGLLPAVIHCPSSSGGVNEKVLRVEYQFNDSNYFLEWPTPGFANSRGGTGEYIRFNLGYDPNGPVHKTFLAMNLEYYTGPKKYTISNQSPEMSLWLGDYNSDTVSYADSVQVNIKQFYYINKIWQLDMEFSGRINYWNPSTQAYEPRMLENGSVLWKWDDN